MHAGRLDNNSKTARCYRLLLERLGDWVDAGFLARAIPSDAVGTRVAEVRAAVRGTVYTVDPARRVDRDGQVLFMYRLRREGPADLFDGVRA